MPSVGSVRRPSDGIPGERPGILRSAAPSAPAARHLVPTAPLAAAYHRYAKVSWGRGLG